MLPLGTNKLIAKRFALPGTWRRSFFVTLFFVTLAAFLFWLDTFRGYESEVRVLVIGKSSSVATDQVVENFAELSQNLSFYDRVLASHDLIDDDFASLPKDQRKEKWNELVQVERSDKSGVLTVTAREATAEKAKRLSEQTAQTLFAVASFYYNIKTDIDLRVVDEPIVKPTVRTPLMYIITSLGSALLVTTLFFGILSVLPFFFGKKKTGVPQFEVGATVPWIDPKKFVPSRPTSLSFESHQEGSVTPVKPVIAATPITKAPAPQSLPVMEERMLPGMDIEELPFQFETTPEEEVAIPETEVPVSLPVSEPAKTEVVEESKTGEPTIEEYKRRLNELLAGGK